MARLYLMDFKPQPLILSIEESVGRCGANKRLDVMLVQFFLNVTARHNEKSWGWFIDRIITKPNIDGMYGPITQDWINRFQKHLKHKVVADGRVDAIVNGVSDTAAGGPLTMYMLNVAYYVTFGEGAISRIVNHPLMPRELARTFMMHGRNW